MAIWMLVEKCAVELTEKGLTPFTRSDIIQWVQKKNPEYGPDSINPIIQGITDNLRGGAPGAIGKNILHSVGRGLFVLSKGYTDQDQQFSSKQSPQKSFGTIINNPDLLVVKKTTHQISGKMTFQLEGYEFNYVCDIEPDRDHDGSILTFMPQSKYLNPDELPLNKYGKGPFCKFKIPSYINYSGVYALVESTNIKYIGECVSLSSRYNSGYGNISPRNCFIGGQDTNCRINNLILQEITAGRKISLWFHRTSDYKSIESSLRSTLVLNWNKA